MYPTSDFVLSGSLHSALYHPSIVSLISTFSAPSGYYQVLELHQEGTLANLLYARASHVLTEPELRGVARTLIDALIYLKKELVLHRDINPSNIMITQHGRIVRHMFVLKRGEMNLHTYRSCPGLVRLSNYCPPTLPSMSSVARQITYLRKYVPISLE